MSRFALLCFLSAAVFLTACSSASDKTDITQQESVDTLYNRAASALDRGDYIAAASGFEEVERQHPYSEWATKAQLMAAYASYEGQRYDEALLALDRFIQLHPGNKDIDYAYYLKALSLYEQISDVERDQDMTAQSVKALDALIRRFPDSKYTRDAKLKRDLTKDHLAGKEMEIGRYYLNRGHVNAAINRFRMVIQRFQTTTHTAEALHRLVEAYLLLGVKQEALKVAAVLGHNYPGSKWYEKSYELLDDESRAKIIADRGFIDRTVDSILKPD
jgi:outer membrane protein assembly factor BamD